jgi:hypothetical protein
MDDSEEDGRLIWPIAKRKSKQILTVVPGTREEWSPGLITCQGKCSDKGVFWEWHDLVSGMYQCRECGNRRHWGTTQYRNW